MRPHFLAPCTLLLACEADPTTADDTGPQSVLPACPSAWTEHEEGVQLQPTACLAWSPRTEEQLDWYEAVGPEDAVAGGCGAHCSDEPGHCDELDLAGIIDWRVPSVVELEAAASGAPPLEPLDEPLWSRDSVAAAEDMAYQVELDTPELTFTQGKAQDGWLRCVADL
jgi:hypothetical protein